MKKLLCALLLLCMLFATGCGAAESNTIRATNLSETLTREAPIVTAIIRPYHGMLTNLGLQLMQETIKAEAEGENLLLSPLSVLYAMAMVSEGADQTEAVKAFWGNLDQIHVNEFMYEYAAGLPQGEKAKLGLANSIWFKDDESFTANQDFLRTMVNYYGADVYKAPFNNQTCKDINKWVEQKTDGMIKNILDQIPADAVMYLVNALAFEAEWETPYTEYQQREDVFTKEDGTKQTATFLYGNEDTYLEDELATGFVKPYHGGDYAFVALLPKEGVTPEEYLASLTAEKLENLLIGTRDYNVITSMPVFETAYDVEMKDLLSAMGYPVNSTFGGMGTSTEGSILLSRILHKTYIRVDAMGTKAGAATVVESVTTGMPEVVPKVKEVHLDRPFVYMIIDTEKNVPLFIGVMKDLKS